MKHRDAIQEQHGALWNTAQRAGMSRREFLILLASGGAAAVLAACAPNVGPAPASTETKPSPLPTKASTVVPTPTLTASGPQGDLTVGLSTLGAESFDPVKSMRTSSVYMSVPMFDFLVSTDITEKVSTGIAESWEMAADRLSWTFHIRKGITFHDGSPLTAKDVKFSLDRFASKEAYDAYIRDAQDRVEVLDDYTVRVFTKDAQPYYPRFVNMVPANQGIIMPKDYIEKNGLDYFIQHPVGSGPFKFVRHVKGDMVEFEGVGNFRSKPAFKKLSLLLIPEEATRVAALKTGQVDIIDIGVESARNLEAAGMKTVAMAGNQANVLFFGAYDPRAKTMPVGNIKVREALSLAINRDEIGKTIFYGKLQPPMPPNVWQNQPEIDVSYWRAQAAKYYRYDPEEAKRLLAEAGYSQGFPIKLHAYVAGGATYLPQLAPIIVDYWGRIGVKVEIVPGDQAAFKAFRSSGPNGTPPDALVGQASLFGVDGNVVTSRALSSFFWGPGNYDLISGKLGQNSELNNLIPASLSETNDVKRKEMIAKAIQLALDTRVCAVIGTVPTMAGIGPRVDINFPADALSIPLYVDTAKHAAR